MYIIVIAWLYITVLVAATETSLVAGLLSLLFYGLLPAALFLYVFGSPTRRRAGREAARARLPQQAVDKSADESTDKRVDDVVGKPDGGNAEQDQ